MMILNIAVLMFNIAFFVQHFIKQNILWSIAFALAAGGSFLNILEGVKVL